MLAGLDSIAMYTNSTTCGVSTSAHFYVHPYYHIDFIMETTVPADKQVTKRIVNGFDLSAKSAPYAVYLEVQIASKIYIACSGSIISENYVLTAAHCVQFDGGTIAAKKVAVGYNNQDVDDQFTFSPSRIVLHPNYLQKNGTVNMAYDIALLQVPKLKLNSTTQRIPIYTGTVFPGEYMMASGWGATENGKLSDQLRGILQIAGEISECKGYSKGFVNHNGANVCVPDRLVPGQSVSTGDSGGALVLSSRTSSSSGGVGKQMLAGIASYVVSRINKKCGTQTSASFFLRPSKYVDFITKTTGLAKSYLNGTCSSNCVDSDADVVTVTKTIIHTPTNLPTY
ncbi:hypothetical protein LPJ72_004717 [Coemansia sp. Benny D160-2]|nr:hypothetical protein LPJ72_004717 [Coemansia sp. Benny D160-2]